MICNPLGRHLCLLLEYRKKLVKILQYQYKVISLQCFNIYVVW